MYCPGYCCIDNVVNLCGYDVWLIATRLGLNPVDFVAFAELNEESPYNIRVDSSDKAYCLALHMKELSGGKRSCIFALNLPRSQTRCGIYTLRPIGCRAYPLALMDKEVMVKPWALCPKGSWEHNPVDKEFWQKELARHDMEFSIYAFMLAAWNIAAQQRSPGVLDFHPFLTYLMDTYSRLDALRAEIAAESWPHIHMQWRQYSSEGFNPLFVSLERKIYEDDWDKWLASIRKAVLTTINDVKPIIIKQEVRC